MPDRGRFWSPVPDWSQAAIEHRDLRIAALPPPRAWLLSGRLDPFLAARGGLRCLGPREACDGQLYALRLAPDRALLVAREPAAVEPPALGWTDGMAVTEVGDGFVLVEVTGRAAPALMRLGAHYPFEAKPDAPAESAQMLFAGLRVAVARLRQGWRLHVERPYAPALWHWLSFAASEWAKPPAEM